MEAEQLSLIIFLKFITIYFFAQHVRVFLLWQLTTYIPSFPRTKDRIRPLTYWTHIYSFNGSIAQKISWKWASIIEAKPKSSLNSKFVANFGDLPHPKYKLKESYTWQIIFFFWQDRKTLRISNLSLNFNYNLRESCTSRTNSLCITYRAIHLCPSRFCDTLNDLTWLYLDKVSFYWTVSSSVDAQKENEPHNDISNVLLLCRKLSRTLPTSLLPSIEPETKTNLVKVIFQYSGWINNRPMGRILLSFSVKLF